MKKRIKLAALGLLGAYAGSRLLTYIIKEDSSLDADNPYLSREAAPEARRLSIYEGIVKPELDALCGFFGGIALLPVFAGISAAIYLDDPGPVIFSQKRVGKGKHYFMMYKFRTMKLSTPHDVPTHLLRNPEQYITRTGSFLRRYSGDELAQILNLITNQISIVGPRPALWNQADLIAERDRYGANDIKPGITGWAQINGRDELSIEEKARYDGEYAAALKKGGWTAFKMDLRCFFGTFLKVLRHEGVVEGGPGHGGQGVTAANTMAPAEPETGGSSDSASAAVDSLRKTLAGDTAAASETGGGPCGVPADSRAAEAAADGAPVSGVDSGAGTAAPTAFETGVGPQYSAAEPTPEAAAL